MIPVKIINLNKKKMEEDLKKYSSRTESIAENFNNINMTAQEQKWYWLQIFLPTVAALVLLFAVPHFIGMLDIRNWIINLLKILFCLIDFAFIGNRMVTLLNKSSLTKFFKGAMSGEMPYPVTFYKTIKNKTIIDNEVKPVEANGEILAVPLNLTLEDEFGKKSYYSFASAPWTIVKNKDNAIVLDAEKFEVRCPIFEDEADETD